MTDVREETLRRIHMGWRDLQIATELNERYGFPGRESDFFGPIADLRAEIENFRREAPGLAREAFSRGYDWRQVFAGLEAKGLLSSGEIVHICIVSRREACPEDDVAEPHVDDKLEKQRAMLDALNDQVIAAAAAVAAHIEGTTDPVLRDGVSAFESMISENEQNKHDNKRRDQ